MVNFRVDCMYSMLSIVFTIIMTTSKHGIMSRQSRNDRIQCIGLAVAHRVGYVGGLHASHSARLFDSSDRQKCHFFCKDTT